MKVIKMKGYIAGLLFVSGAYATTPNILFSRINPLVAQIGVLQELKKGFEAPTQQVLIKKAAKVPTVQHIKSISGTYPSLWGGSISDIPTERAAYKDLVDSVINKEHHYCDQYYVFYHGQSNQFRILQDFLKEIYALMGISVPLSDFEFLRIRHKAEKSLNQDSFINSEEGAALGYQAWHDWQPHLVKNMICVNLALFGNWGNVGEQTFWYFKNSMGGNGVSVLDALMKGLFADFGFDSNYIPELDKLKSTITTSEGNLFQIFIPKDKVDKYVYLSYAFGTPYRTPIVSSVFDSKKNRHIKISPILEAYLNDPKKISGFDGLQARILLSQDGMLNPESGIKIFRYTTVPDAQLKIYQNKVKTLVREIVGDAIEKKTFKSNKDTRFGKLLSYMKK